MGSGPKTTLLELIDKSLQPSVALASDGGVLVGRVWRPDQGGPSVVSVRNGTAIDLTAHTPTMTDLSNSQRSRKLKMALSMLCRSRRSLLIVESVVCGLWTTCQHVEGVAVGVVRPSGRRSDRGRQEACRVKR